MIADRLISRAIAYIRPVMPGLSNVVSRLQQRRTVQRFLSQGIRRANLCCGLQRVPGYIGLDTLPRVDVEIDLARENLPFGDCSLETIVWMSAINYFPRRRAQELVHEIFRVLHVEGVCRVGVQDMRLLAERYIREDKDFFFQKLSSGQDRFEGHTIGDKFAAWFYGYAVGSNHCCYAYDFDSLAYLFREAGFTQIERRAFGESRIPDILFLDNRPDQMFYLEAVK